MKSQHSRQRLVAASQKPPMHLMSNEKAYEKSRNQNKSQSIVNSSPTYGSHTLQDQDNLRIKAGRNGGGHQAGTQKSQNTRGYTTLNQEKTFEMKQPSRKTTFNTPLRGSISKAVERVPHSTSKLGNMTAVQLNQQQIEIEQQINSLSDSFKADQQIKSEKIKVAVRVRPFLQKELAKENVCYVSKNVSEIVLLSQQQQQGQQIRVSDLSHTIEGTYDRVIPKEASQSEAYSFVQDCIPNLLQGFNCTIFAYGQTGSGKTYTMFGEGFNASLTNRGSLQMSQNNGLFNSNNQSQTDFNGKINYLTQYIGQSQYSDFGEKRGIIPRCISELFQQIKKQNLKVTIYCSFLQIYNEKLFDLLQDTYTKNPLQIREEKLQGIYVEGLSEYVVQDEVDCLNLLKRGEKNRIKRATRMNIKSSRSHTLFQLLLETDQVDAKGMLKRSKLNLGDLAGSEKINKDEEMKAKHMLELRNINLSLTTLGKVIQILSQGANTPPHVPFRESKLTRLLQDSLGGNCQTYLIATVSPIMDSIEETISTLKFADRAKCVMQRVKKNEINAKDDALVQKLQKEVQHLKELLQMKRKGVNPNDLSHQLYILKDENERLRQMAMNYEDIERMKQENKQMRLELQKLRMLASEVGSNYAGDVTPRSFGGATIAKSINQMSNIDSGNIKVANMKKQQSVIQNQQNYYEILSDTDESIQEQFKNYKSELNFEVKLTDNKRQSKGVTNNQTELQTDREATNVKNQSINRIEKVSSSDKDILSSGVKNQKDKLQKIIQEQQSPSKPKQAIALKKRYKEGDLSDEGNVVYNQQASNGNITLPAINDGQVSLQQQQFAKVDFTRKNSNQDLYKLSLNSNNNQSIVSNLNNGNSHSPYSLNRSSINPLLQKSTENYLSDINKPLQHNVIQKYPQRQVSNIRRSLHEFPQSQHSTIINQASYPQQPNLTSIQSEVNRSYQIGSQGLVGLTTQSSLYGMHNQQSFTLNSSAYDKQGDGQYKFRNRSPIQTVVRIRGRHNQMIETKGSVLMTLEEEKRILEKKKQLRRSNDRLRMLETMERARQEKVERELEQLMQEKVKREQEDLHRREIIKQRKYVNANVGIIGDALTNASGVSFNALREKSKNGDRHHRLNSSSHFSINRE